ncbi:hypothetical protein DB347_04900 [Opitutaceae bacterium EW11]|nr:hypothetical protein DB347_04900 [Opitutaceae bacterium EW11]
MKAFPVWVLVLNAAFAACCPGGDPVWAYQKRLDELDRRARAEGAVHYRQVLECAYSSSWLDVLLEQKAVYRSWLASRFPIFSHYERMEREIPVDFEVSRTVVDGMTEAASYFVAADRILVRTVENPGRSLVHESGHSLQHERLAELGKDATVCDRRLARFAAKRREPRLDYLLQQAEFEVRLQDLNRFYAAFHAGTPILTPQDAICALAMMGTEVTAVDIESALAGLQVSWPPPASRKLLRQSLKNDGFTRSAFADAFTLKELLGLARLRSRELYLTVLQKILFESPAHL